MKHKLYILISFFMATFPTACIPAPIQPKTPEQTCTIENSAYRLSVTNLKTAIHVKFYDKLTNRLWSDSKYLYRAARSCEAGKKYYDKLGSIKVEKSDDTIKINARFVALELEQSFNLPHDKPVMNENLKLCNRSGVYARLLDFEAGFIRNVADAGGKILSNLKNDRLVAVPFRHRATDPPHHDNDYSIAQILNTNGKNPQKLNFPYMKIPPRHQVCEGWTWQHAGHNFCIFKFNQKQIDFSVISRLDTPEGPALRFGGACMISSTPLPRALVARLYLPSPRHRRHSSRPFYRPGTENRHAKISFTRTLLQARRIHRPNPTNPLARPSRRKCLHRKHLQPLR